MRKAIAGYEGHYEVDTEGNIYGVSRNVPIVRKPYEVKGGYKRVRFQKDGTDKHFLVHRLVAQAFIPNPNNYSQVNHKDKNTGNNRVDNLEWVTSHQNQTHARCKMSVWTHPKLGEHWVLNLAEFAKVWGLSRGNLGEVLKGTRKQHKEWEGRFVTP